MDQRPTALEIITLALMNADLYIDNYDDCAHGAQFILDMLHEQGFHVQ